MVVGLAAAGEVLALLLMPAEQLAFPCFYSTLLAIRS